MPDRNHTPSTATMDTKAKRQGWGVRDREPVHYFELAAFSCGRSLNPVSDHRRRTEWPSTIENRRSSSAAPTEAEGRRTINIANSSVAILLCESLLVVLQRWLSSSPGPASSPLLIIFFSFSHSSSLLHSRARRTSQNYTVDAVVHEEGVADGVDGGGSVPFVGGYCGNNIN